ncbi:MAG: HDIG domain-containing protein, partial [Planctomycetia bacterium]|nr:HDIG domain-containing protein [Planctomycetia bacterium]
HLSMAEIGTKAGPTSYGLEQRATETGFAYAVILLAGTIVAVFSLGEVNNRLKPIKVGFYSGLALAGAMLGFILWHGVPLDRLALVQVVVAFSYGVGAGVATLALLPFVEGLFGITTNISLLELCDVNQPALRQLGLQAPGTYTHSLLIGNLAEAAAASIGANGLLARVGAYFHDIGKVNKPQYFTENQQSNTTSEHEALTPAMSKLVIMAHVKDGLELAERYGLPPAIRQFISQHHGTTLVQYFFHEAARKQADSGEEPPLEAEYRYAGPKPRSKETAIVMLADAVEGQTRSVKEPTAARVAAVVKEVSMNRLMDGQLDESELTLSELHKIQESLTKTLVSVYHTRVAYPSGEEVAEAKGGSAADGN